MTDAEMEGLGAQSLNMAKLDLERGEFNFLLASYHQGEPLHRMRKIEALIVSKLGSNWLNSGGSKDLGFHVLRCAVDMLPPDGVVFVTAANAFKPTEKLLALPVEGRRRILEAGHDTHHRAVKDGLLEVCDVLIAIVQTPARVCQYSQEFERGQIVGPPRVSFMSQDGFDGRLKMFGEGKNDCRRSN